MDIKKFKKEHSTFIAVGTTLIIVGFVMLVWKCMKKYCGCGKCESCGNNTEEE